MSKSAASGGDREHSARVARQNLTRARENSRGTKDSATRAARQSAAKARIRNAAQPSAEPVDEPVTGPAGGKTAWRIALAVTIAVLGAIGVTAAIVLPGDHSGGKAAAPPKPVPGSGSAVSVSASPSASPSPSGIEIVPGKFGTPSLPGTDPHDPWRGARPIAGVNLDTFKNALTAKWHLEFDSFPLLGGLQYNGLGGDGSRRQRRLDAVISVDDRHDNLVYQVMCQVGGSEIVPTDDSSMEFMADCLQQAVPQQEWPTLKTWLDQNLRGLASNPGANTWYQLSAMRMYVESSGHIVSCTLTNS